MTRIQLHEQSTATTTAEVEDQIDGFRAVYDVRGQLVRRKVVGTLAECLEKKGDFYHPDFGWLRAGGKRERDAADKVGIVF